MATTFTYPEYYEIDDNFYVKIDRDTEEKGKLIVTTSKGKPFTGDLMKVMSEGRHATEAEFLEASRLA